MNLIHINVQLENLYQKLISKLTPQSKTIFFFYAFLLQLQMMSLVYNIHIFKSKL